MIVNGGLLLYNSTEGNFISVRGVCRQVEAAGIRKRIKNIYIDTEPYTLKLPVRQRIRNLNMGDTIIVYLSENKYDVTLNQWQLLHTNKAQRENEWVLT